MNRFAHIVNPVLVDAKSDLYKAQPISFESLRAAQRKAAKRVPIELLAVGYPEDHAVMPEGFQSLAPLTRSVLDVSYFHDKRKLPLLRDILKRLYEGSDADYLIYTNVDIGVQPDFYLALQGFVGEGLDALVINRRTIAHKYDNVADLPQIWSEVGKAHRGWDCFVFHREIYRDFVLGNVCIGAPRVGLAFLANLMAIANHFFEFKSEYLTFHLGDDRSWRGPSSQVYADHNTQELDIVLAQLEEKYGPFPSSTAPGAYLFKRRHFGRLYENWVHRAYLPPSWSQRINSLLGKVLGK